MVNYPVLLDENIVGMAILQREGMLWKIVCVCCFDTDKAQSIFAFWSGGSCEIGRCFGKNEQIVKRVSIHKFQLEDLSFRIQKDNEILVEFDEGNKLGNVSDLRYAKLEWCDGKPCLRYDINPAQGLPDNDQSP